MLRVLGTLMVAVLVVGCASVQRRAPVAPAQIMLNMGANDYTVLGTTKGTATQTSILCGVVRIIDSDKFSVLGIRFFEDQYATQEDPGWWVRLPVISFFFGPSVIDRALYKALAATPDADAVVEKSREMQEYAFPPLFSTETATLTGKALKYKAP